MGQVQPIDIVAPGAFGITTEKAGLLLQPQWATVALNAVVNKAGRVAARKGWQDQTTNAIASTPTIDVLHEYINKAGASIIISVAANKLYKDVDDFTDAGNLITSTTAPSADHWQFINFNNKVLGFQRGEVPIEWAGSSVFTDASYTGTGPDGNCAVSAFGRVWAADADLQTVRYSALLDDTDYSTASGGGTIDMSSVWTNDMDRIVALASLGAMLVVFGENHIVLWADRSGSEIGLDATQLEVVDTIEGTGLLARDSIQVTGEGDLIFLSRHGLQALGRVIASKSNPTVTLSKNVRSNVLESIKQTRTADAEFDRVRSFVSPEEGLYVINFPTQDKQYVIDLEHPFSDDDGAQVFPMTEWILGGSIAGVLALASTGDIYFGSAGVVGKYAGFDDNAVAYDFELQTGWLNFENLNHNIKMLKEIVTSIQTGNQEIVWNWEFDFNGTQLTRSTTYTLSSKRAEFNVSEFSDGGGAGVGYNDPAIGAASGETEFSGSAVIQRKLIPAHGEGQFLKLGVTASVNGTEIVVQHLSVSPKIGRMVT